MELASQVEGLYRLPPDEFVPARDQLVKDLRAGGHRDEAKEVKGLRRPTVAAWALNQAARERADLVESLAELGQELREAQELALSEGNATALRAATARRRQVVGGLAAAASSVLDRAGRDARTQAPAIAAILEAAVTNPGVAALMRQGRLVSEPEPDDLEHLLERSAAGAGAGLAAVPAPATEDGPRPARSTRRAGKAGKPPTRSKPAPATGQAAQRKAVGSARWDHERAVRGATEAAAALDAATARAATAAADHEQAQRRLDAAAKAVADTEAKREAAARAHEEAQALVHRTATALAHARQALGAGDQA